MNHLKTFETYDYNDDSDAVCIYERENGEDTGYCFWMSDAEYVQLDKMGFIKTEITRDGRPYKYTEFADRDKIDDMLDMMKKSKNYNL